jgi:hypothetical protein
MTGLHLGHRARRLVVIGLTTACFAKGRVLFGVIGGR